MDRGAAVLIPVKDFGAAKGRLADALSQDERAHLAEWMATRVVRAAAPLPVVIVCDSEAVRIWAEQLDARVIWTPGLGLNGAVQAGLDDLSASGVGRAVIAHSDLPLATGFDWLLDTPDVTLVPDRVRDGTNVMIIPTDVGFEVAYGPRSFAAHRGEAKRLGLVTRIVTDAALSWDVDEPADLDHPQIAAAATAAKEAP